MEGLGDAGLVCGAVSMHADPEDSPRRQLLPRSVGPRTGLEARSLSHCSSRRHRGRGHLCPLGLPPVGFTLEVQR